MFEISFSQSSRLNSFFLLVSPLSVWSSGLCKLLIVWDFCWVFVCLSVFPLMGQAEWGGNSVCWWLDLYFRFVCCLDEAPCTGYYWWLDDARYCIQVFSFVWVLTIWSSLGIVLWSSRVLESVLPLQRLRAWSLFRNEDSTSGLLWHLVRLKQTSKNKKPNMNPSKRQLQNQANNN